VIPPRPNAERAVERVEAALARLRLLHPSVIDLTLERVHRLLARLGHPERALAPVVHVAGTNGKGSTVAFLRAFLEAAGLRVHVYTSPHLVRFNERIRLGGRIIDDAALASLLEECEAVNAGEPITFFEITTCAAFLAFAREPADVVLLETGLGGRLDATNVVGSPAVTVVTPVSMDHMDYLGATLPEIAAEKAGILKPGVPCVLAPQPVEAGRVLAARAASLGVPLDRAGVDWWVEADGDGFAIEDGAGHRSFPMPALAGPHQPVNAAVAISGRVAPR
jgi:dihydrofolate synthase/folylpolyglutamate synthase